jgi:hypothetical protein
LSVQEGEYALVQFDNVGPFFPVAPQFVKVWELNEYNPLPA